MASVRMTKELKAQLTDAYRKQCQTAYNTEFNVEDTVNEIVEAIQNSNAKDFAMLVETAENFEKLMRAHSDKYQHLQTNSGYRHITGSINNTQQGYDEKVEECNPLKKTTKLFLVCNKGRMPSDNLKPIQGWHTTYTDKWNNTQEHASKTYVDGDVLFIHDFGENPVYLPYYTSGEEQNYHAKEDYSPSASLAVLISDPAMCDKLESIPMAKQKVSDMVKKFEDFVEPQTTLKKFLDEFPGGKSLVPSSKLQAMAAPAVKRQVKAKVTANDLLTPDLKQEFNEVMLESTLLGDN